MILLGTTAALGQSAPSFSSYTAVATADASRLSVAAPGATIVDVPIDLGGLTVQARADSLGNREAFASNPYPGDLLVSLPGLMSGLTGVTNLPPYPAYIKATHPSTPSDQITQPGFVLAVDAGEDGARARAVVGADAPDGEASAGGASDAAVDASGETVTAEARTSGGTLQIGALRLDGIRSHAKVERRAEEDPVRTSSLEVGRVDLAGVDLNVTREGVTLADTPPGLPLEPVEALLNELFASTGTNIIVLEAEDTEHGVIAPGIQITMKQTIAQLGTSATITVTLGRAFAEVSPVVASPSSDATDGAAVADIPAQDAPAVDVPLALPAPRPSVVPPASRPPAQRIVASATAVPFDLDHIYPVLVGAALVAVGCFELSRSMSVRWRWTS